MRIYNSSLKDYHKSIPYTNEIENFTCDLGIGFVHDIIKGLPCSYNVCNAIYIENFWQNGHNTLPVKYSFVELQHYISMVANKFEGKFYLVTGKSCLKYFNGYHKVSEIYLHNYKSILIQWNDRKDIPDYYTNYDLLIDVVKENNCIGDFMCGYGNTIIECIKQNKNFVCSDISKDCISVLNERIINKIY